MLCLNNLVQKSRRSIPTTDARISLARDIHDGIAQDLVAVGYQLDALLARPQMDQQTRSELRDIRLSITETLAEVRQHLFELRQGPTHFAPAMRSLYESICSGFGGSCDIEELDLPDEDARLLLGCSRELLLNAVRHSGGTSIWLRALSTPQHVVVTVSDDGSGQATLGSDRLGLLGVVEKMTEHGGRCEISGNRGSTITLSLPR